MDIILPFLNSTSHQHINPIITHFIILSLHTSIPSFIQSNNIVIFILSHIHFIQQTIINILSLHIITPPSTHSIIHYPYSHNTSIQQQSHHTYHYNIHLLSQTYPNLSFFRGSISLFSLSPEYPFLLSHSILFNSLIFSCFLLVHLSLTSSFFTF